MIKHLRICCPNCQRTLKARVEYLNKRVVCNHCLQPFLARPEDKEPPYSPVSFSIDASRTEECRSLVASSSSGLDVAEGFDPEPQLERSGSSGPTPPGADRGAAPPCAADAASGQPAGREIQAEIDDLRARHEPLLARAEAAGRLGLELGSARAELDQVRVTVKILQADIVARSAAQERLEARHAAALDQAVQLRARIAELERSLAEAEARNEADRAEHARLLAEAHSLWEQERQAIAEQAGAMLAEERSRGEARERETLARLDQARGRLEAIRARAETHTGPAEEPQPEHERGQDEVAQLRAQVEHQRLRLEAERQAQRQEFSARRKLLEEKLQARAAAIHEGPAGPGLPTATPDADPRPEDEPQPGPDAPPEAAASPSPDIGDPIEVLDQQFRALRSHLREIHEAGAKEKAKAKAKAGQPLASRLARIWRQDGPPSSD